MRCISQKAGELKFQFMAPDNSLFTSRRQVLAYLQKKKPSSVEMEIDTNTEENDQQEGTDSSAEVKQEDALEKKEEIPDVTKSKDLITNQVLVDNDLKSYRKFAITDAGLAEETFRFEPVVFVPKIRALVQDMELDEDLLTEPSSISVPINCIHSDEKLPNNIKDIQEVLRSVQIQHDRQQQEGTADNKDVRSKEDEGGDKEKGKEGQEKKNEDGETDTSKDSEEDKHKDGEKDENKAGDKETVKDEREESRINEKKDTIKEEKEDKNKDGQEDKNNEEDSKTEQRSLRFKTRTNYEESAMDDIFHALISKQKLPLATMETTVAKVPNTEKVPLKPEEEIQDSKGRNRLSEQETVQLDRWFDKNPYPNLEERTNISQIMNIPEKKVRIWFQNKRCKTDEGKMKCFFARNNIQNSDSGEDEEDLQESNYLIFFQSGLSSR